MKVDELKKICEQALEFKKSSTQVTAWYPHSQSDAYRPGYATVRGPFFRWFLVEKGTASGEGHLADQYEDAKFCAFAMNNIVGLAEELLSILKDSHREDIKNFSLLE